MFNLANIEKEDWTKFWSLKFSLLSASILGRYYSAKMKCQMDADFGHVIIVSKQSYSSCILSSQRKKEFGRRQIARYIKEGSISEFCTFLNSKTADILQLLKKLMEKDLISNDEFLKLVDMIDEYTGYYTVPRMIIDSIESSEHSKIETVFYDLKEARMHAEPVYSLINDVIYKFAKQISTEVGYNANLLCSMTIQEFEEYMNDGKIPEKKILQRRFEWCALIFEENGYICITDKDQIKRLEQIHIKKTCDNIVFGEAAFSGKAKGIARIIFDPLTANNFNEGDVLITGMTRPDFLSIMKKASAIVTDCGGLLCHAAIVARELKKPTIIGTKNATSMFNDGDIIEVDANKGIARKIS